MGIAGGVDDAFAAGESDVQNWLIFGMLSVMPLGVVVCWCQKKVRLGNVVSRPTMPMEDPRQFDASRAHVVALPSAVAVPVEEVAVPVMTDLVVTADPEAAGR